MKNILSCYLNHITQLIPMKACLYLWLYLRAFEIQIKYLNILSFLICPLVHSKVPFEGLFFSVYVTLVFPRQWGATRGRDDSWHDISLAWCWALMKQSILTILLVFGISRNLSRVWNFWFSSWNSSICLFLVCMTFCKRE